MTEPQPSSRKVIASWASFDFAMGSFSTIMVVSIFPNYFQEHIVTNGHGDLYWGLTTFGSMLLVALVTPLLGAMADVRNNKKLYLASFAGAVILCTAALYFMQPGMMVAAALLYLIANAGYEGGLVFYDAFLPGITTPKTFGKVSGIGFAVGYAGSLSILLISIPFLKAGAKGDMFLITSFAYFAFAIPLFLNVPEKKQSAKIPFGQVARRGFSQLASTVRNIRSYPNVTRFLLAYFLYNDGILTVVTFSGIYAKHSIHFDDMDLAMFFIMIQVVAIVGSLVFGRMADRIGPKRSIQITLFIWVGVVALAFFADTKMAFYVVGGLAGVSLGSSQACSRSLMALLTPTKHTAEFFGFYDGFAGRASGIIGPLAFGVLSEIGGQRTAILMVSVFFLGGLLLLKRVREARAEEAEMAAEAVAA